MRQVYVLGAGAHPWGKFPDTDQVSLARSAIAEALSHAGISWRDVGGLVAASSRFEGGMGWGLHGNEILQNTSEAGIPCINVGGACAAGGVAFTVAHALVASGQYDCVIAAGAERMPKGFIARPPGGMDAVNDDDYVRWKALGATNPAYWAMEARRRQHEHGTSTETFAKASVLMHANAVGNKRARYRKPCTVEEVLSSPEVADPLHLLEICAVSDGAAAVVLTSEKFAQSSGGRALRVAGCAAATASFGDPAVRIPAVSANPRDGVHHTSEVVNAANRAMKMAGLDHKDIDLLEIADNSVWQVLHWPEMLGFVKAGEADHMLEAGEFGIDGRLPVNPSGGFLSFGEATTAQALLQICELAWQLRGEAEGHQVDDARTAMSAVLGLGANGASVILQK